MVPQPSRLKLHPWLRLNARSLLGCLFSRCFVGPLTIGLSGKRITPSCLPQPACTLAYGNMEEPIPMTMSPINSGLASLFVELLDRNSENRRIATGTTATTIIDNRVQQQNRNDVKNQKRNDKKHGLYKYNIIHSIHFNTM